GQGGQGGIIKKVFPSPTSSLSLLHTPSPLLPAPSLLMPQAQIPEFLKKSGIFVRIQAQKVRNYVTADHILINRLRSIKK
ncbi:hypothetical protein, partial [Nostoc sp. UIC 10630]|uniref:hypothetical protein n=1 Tax=Nostoc sp. UIC 10630 TaxID=2100146 RepID=UPI001A9C94F3